MKDSMIFTKGKCNNAYGENRKVNFAQKRERRNGGTKTRANREGETGFAQWVELTKREKKREKEKEERQRKKERERALRQNMENEKRET